MGVLNYKQLSDDKLEYVAVALIEEIGNGQRFSFEIDYKRIAIFNVGGQYFAMADICSHDDGPLAEGEVDGLEIVCPRHGARFDAGGQVVNSNGYRLMPEVILPEGFIRESLTISQDGRVTVKIAGINDPIEVGQIETYRFINPSGLLAIGENLFKVTNATGNVIAGRPGFDGMGKVIQKFLEMSNVSVVQEMVNMIVAQRAYETNSKAIQTSDSMLATANSLKR